MRLPSLLRVCLLAVMAMLALVLVTPGCGRSSLEPETLDGGTTTPTSCNPQTCPSGCCDSSGTCRTGTDARACGGTGLQCTDCVAAGFPACDARKTCSRPGCEGCTGCCEHAAGGDVCHVGTQAALCGKGGAVCADCATDGRSCDLATGKCGAGKCDATNCAGCCVGDQCLAGTDLTACGAGGEACTSCQATGQRCRAQSGGGGACRGTPTCGPANCGGCCEGTTCVTGTDANACGKQGAACADCSATGKTCVPPGQPNERTCQTPVTCGPANCPGCCVGNQCVVSTTAAACGKGGAACVACGANQTCTAGTCQAASTCGPASCNGCCIGDICATGNQATACGTNGVNCQNCAGQAKVCQGGSCQTPVCGPGNCAGCCSGNTCVIGTQDNACGGAGAACNDCTGAGQACQNRVCVDKCGPANCVGCCTGTNVCALGFANNACGENGVACANCTAGGSTCDALVSPRVCQIAQTTCPAAYGACPAGVTSPITPTLQGLCADLDLDALQTACASTPFGGGGPDSASCQAAFKVLAGTNAACATCLAPFDVPFGSLSGIYTCVAPSVSATCNRSTGCAVDCTNKSCDQCDPTFTSQCESQVDANGGQCFSYITQTACVGTALGPGKLCSPQTYGGNFGSWLRAVGDHFCGNGP
jgi:hypothetical protein